MALADGFDWAYLRKHDLQMMLKHNVPIIMLTDSLSLFDIIAK
jgi:hypothetical protein